MPVMALRQPNGLFSGCAEPYCYTDSLVLPESGCGLLVCCFARNGMYWMYISADGFAALASSHCFN